MYPSLLQFDQDDEGQIEGEEDILALDIEQEGDDLDAEILDGSYDQSQPQHSSAWY